MVEIDVRDAISKLNGTYGYLSNQKRNLAVARAINHTIAKAKTQVSREIRSIYDINAKYVSQALTITKADSLTLTGMVKAKGRPIPLIAFKARQTATGVSVIGLKGRKIIPGVFISTMPNGHKGVYIRGKYSSGKLSRRKKRINPKGPDLPITELKGVSLPKAMANKIILTNLGKAINTMFPQRLAHELQRVSTILPQ